MNNLYFDQEFLEKLERLSLRTRKAISGRNSGDRRSPHKGQGVELADFRNYTIGDDFRYIDWNALARTERLFLKLFMEEKDLLLHIFLDTSQSMDWGEPSKNRLARQLAGAFAYLALAGFDRVGVVAFSERLTGYLPPTRGRSSLRQVWDFIEGLPNGGTTNLNQALKDFGRYARAGIALVISDLMSPHGFKEGLKYLGYLRQEVILLQVLSPDEVNPGLNGDVRLLDVETRDFREVTINAAILRAYRQRLQAFTEDTRTFCLKQGLDFAQVTSEMSFEEVILRHLPAAGILAK